MPQPLACLTLQISSVLLLLGCQLGGWYPTEGPIGSAGMEAWVFSEWCWDLALTHLVPQGLDIPRSPSLIPVVSWLLGRAPEAQVFWELFLTFPLISTFSLPRSHPAPPCLGVGDFRGYEVGLVTHGDEPLSLWTVTAISHFPGGSPLGWLLRLYYCFNQSLGAYCTRMCH